MKHILRQALKDLRQLRALILVWLGLVALRGSLVAFPLDVRFPALADSSLASIYVALTIAQLALLVVTAVLLVQADPASGSTAFWLTRPVGRVAMVASKLLTATLLLVVVPILADVVVLGANRLPATDLWRAVREGVVERLAIVLPAMGLASLTVDLGGFVLAAVLACAAFVALLVVIADAAAARPASESAILLAVPFAAAWAGGVVVHQYLQRHRSRSAGLAVVGIGLLLAGIHWWPWEVPTTATALEAGSLDPNGVTLALGAPAISARGGQVTVAGRIEARSTARGVLVAPIGLNARIETSGGILASFAAGSLQSESRSRRIDQRRLWSGDAQAAMAAAVGGLQILSRPRPGAPEPMLLVRLSADAAAAARAADAGCQYRAQVTLRAIGFETTDPVAVIRGAGGCAGDGCFALLDVDCEAGACDVLVREVAAAFTWDSRRLSRVDYLLVNRRAGVALLAFDPSQPVLGPLGYSPTAEHIAITHRRLRFEVPPDSGIRVEPAWLAESTIVPVVARDLGLFTRPLVVSDFGALLKPAGASPPGGEVAR